MYKGHQAIVFSRSHVLEKAWKDTPEVRRRHGISIYNNELDNNQEDDPQRVELYEDDDVAVGVGKLVDFLYKLDYDDGSAHSWDIKGCAHKDVPAHKTDSECQLYAIHLSITVAMLGEKYEVGGLQEIASKKFFNALSNIVTKITAGEILEVAKHVYETRSGATIRTIIKQQILDRLSEMMSYTAFRTLVTSNADFAMDLLDHTATIDAGRICRGRHCTFPRETRLVVEVCPSCGDPNYTILHGGAGPIVSDSLKASDNKCAWMDQNSLNVRREWQASTTEVRINAVPDTDE